MDWWGERRKWRMKCTSDVNGGDGSTSGVSQG